MSKQTYSYSIGEDITTELRRRVGDDVDTSIEYMGEESLLYALNEFKRQIWHAPFNGMRIDPLGRIIVRPTGRGWDFSEKEQPFSFVVKTSLTAELTKNSTGDATVADNTNMESGVGAFIVYDSRGTWDYVTHTNKSGTDTVTTVGDVNITHASGETIEHLYKLPTTFERAKKLIIDGDEMHEGPADPDPEHFATYNGYLWMPRNFGVSSGTLVYFIQPTDLTVLSGTLDTPKELNPVLLSLLEAHALSLGGESEAIVDRAYFAAADALEQVMGFTTSSSNKRIKLARPMPRSPSVMRGSTGFSTFDEGYGY